MVGVGVVPAHATEDGELSASDREFLQQQFQRLDIDSSAQAAIVENLEEGILPDAETGANPVDTEVFVENGFEHTRHTYANGSVSEISIEQPVTIAEGTIVPFGVGTCQSKTKVAGVSTWTQCKVEYDAVTWSASYTAGGLIWGVETNTGTRVAQILNPHSPIRGGVGSLSAAKLSKVNNTWWKLTFNQDATIGGVGVNRNVGFDTKITPTGGPRVYAFGS